jgi:phage terminase large subunit-like protein
MTELHKQSKDELIKLAQGLTALRDKTRYNFVDTVFPDEGPLRRELYPKHIEFLNGGAKYSERLFSAANQIGKTLTILLEGYYHASGKYPQWWEGKRFRRPTVGIFGAESWDHMRTGIQSKLLTGADKGSLERGTGIIPKELLDKAKLIAKSNVTGVYAEIEIPHITGGNSKIIFRTYDRQEAWESMTCNWVMLDEEPPRDIYTEAAMRVLANNGTIALGFTPDSGLTETVLHFFKDGEFSAGAADNKLITMVGWDDVPHLTKEAREAAMAQMSPHLVEAKTKGIPYLGEGRIFYFDLQPFIEPSFEIPEHFERCFAVDPGIKRAAVLWGATDPDTGVTYIYDEYGSENLSIYTVADAIKAHGSWIPGVMDPFYGPQSSRESASKIIDLYKESGLDVELCDRKGKDYKEGGIETIKVAFLTGKLKIFQHCRQLINQLHLYHRTSKGRTGNTPDDFVDAIRYLVTGGLERKLSYINMVEEKTAVHDRPGQSSKRSKITGY